MQFKNYLKSQDLLNVNDMLVISLTYLPIRKYKISTFFFCLVITNFDTMNRFCTTRIETRSIQQ